jgi:hypothetical protein
MDWLLFEQFGGKRSVAALDAKVKLACNHSSRLMAEQASHVERA